MPCRNPTARLGALMNRHWELNKILDPNTTERSINEMLAEVRPYVYGAKLAGAGGGGFLMMATRSGKAAAELRGRLDASEGVPTRGGDGRVAGRGAVKSLRALHKSSKSSATRPLHVPAWL